MRDYRSIIEWNKEEDKAPVGNTVLICYKDDTGDSPNYYVATAWRTFDGEHWISDNEEILYDIVAWANMPEVKDIVK